MAVAKTPADTNLIVSAIEREIKKTIDEKYEIAKKELIEKLEKDKAETLAGVSLYIMKQISIHRMAEEIVITLRKPT